jgi:hypothetical protein
VSVEAYLLAGAMSVMAMAEETHRKAAMRPCLTQMTRGMQQGHRPLRSLERDIIGTPHHILPTANNHEGHALFGDMLGLLSAIGYGAYAVMIRVLCPRDESTMSMQLLLGYVGAFNAVVLSPIAVYVLVWPQRIPQTTSVDDDTTSSSSDTVQRLTLVVFGYLVAKGMMDNVLSDYLWARAVILTSATVATVGLGLTIPLAFCSDWIMGHDNVLTASSVLGALSVLTGFILVNLDGDKEETEEGEGTVVMNFESDIAESDQAKYEEQEDKADEAEVVFI